MTGTPSCISPPKNQENNENLGTTFIFQNQNMVLLYAVYKNNMDLLFFT